MKKRTIGIILGLIAVAAVIFYVWPRESRNEAVEVETTAVTQADFRDVVSTVGIIEPTEMESFTGQGPVNEINVEVNEEVAEDDVLATYLDGTELVAPFAGTVIELNIEEDEVDANAQQNQPSLVLANLDNLQVAVNLSKNEASQIAVDQVVELSYLDNEYEGIVTQIDSIATNGQAGGAPLQAGQNAPTLQATISFETEDTSALIPGFDIDADIIISTTTDSLAIPIEAVLYNEDGNPYVFVVVDGKAQMREIETGIQEGVIIEVVNGLELDEEVVQLPSEDLEDGMDVTVANDSQE